MTRSARPERLRATPWWSQVPHDVRYALRTCARTPGLAAVIVLTLALGIGANTTIFSLIDGVLLKPLPYRDPDALVHLVEYVSGIEPGGRGPVRRRGPAVPLDEVPILRARVRLLSDIGAYAPAAVTLASDEGALRVPAARVSAATLAMLGRAPLVGRLFEERDEAVGAEAVAILSYASWRERWRGDPAILGRSIVLDGRTFTVAGVMPQGFHFPDPQTAVWMPLSSGRGRVPVVGRVRAGISRQAANEEFVRVMRELYGDEDDAGGGAAPPSYELVGIKETAVAPVRPALRVLSVAVIVVLFICCVNLASLLLARAFVRQSEIAMRRVLGASRMQIFRQVLTECLLLALVAGSLGIGLAFAGLDAFRGLASGLVRNDLGPSLSIPRLDEVVLDTRVLILTSIVSIGAGLLFGLVPAVWHARTDGLRVADGVNRGSKPWARQATQRALVVAQIALAMMLVLAATLQISSFLRLAAIDPGYDADNVLTFQISRPSGSARATLGDDMVARIRALPDVRDAGYGSALPMIQTGFRGFLLTAPGPPPPRPRPGDDGASPSRPDMRSVSRDFLPTLRARLVEGRGFSESGPDTVPGREVVINRKLAESGYLGRSPLGTQVYSGPNASTVVGIVEDIRQFGLDREPEPQVFTLLTSTRGPEYYVVRTNGTPTTLLPGLRRILGELEPGATIDNVATMDQILSNSVARPRLYASVLGVFATIAGVIAVVGLYAVVAYAVTRRTREIGIRIAIGARPGDVRRLVMGEAFSLSGVGVFLGVIGALVLNRSLSTTLYGVAELGPMPYVIAAAGFAALVLAASYVAAGPALRVDPVVALRAE
jgi:putative ABC transport system permease protein